MVVCKFWLENKCKFGAACRFEHSKDGSQGNLFGSNYNWQGGGGGGQRVTFGNKDGSQYKWSANQSKGQDGGSSSALDVVSALSEEMKRWEESKMWPFSCISVEKDLQSLPDFQDTSPEEMRYMAYQCKAQGSMDPYIKKFQALISEFQTKRRQLQHMTMDLKQTLIKFVEEERRKKATQATPSGLGFPSQSPSSTPIGSSQSLFGKPASFGGGASQSPGQPSSSLFGGSPAQGSLFGGNTGTPSSNSSSVFSTNKFEVLASGSTFGGSGGGGGISGGSLFGKPVVGASNSSMGGNVFGGNQNNNQQPSLFGAAPSASPGLFGTPRAQTAPGLFGSGAAATSQSPGQSVFGFGAGSSSISAGKPAPNLFGSGTSPALPSQPAPNLFGGSGAVTSQPAPNLFGGSAGGTPQTSLLGPVPTGQPPSLFGKGINSLSGAGSSQGQGMPQGAPNLFGKPSPGFSSVFSNQGQTAGSGSGSGLFGKGPSVQGHNSNGAAMGGNETATVESPTLYTPLADLTASEKAAFEAKAFELGKIPIRPPPKELLHA
ncbi:nucleoporin-like protein 2 [Elysia marginata]|uniref:Nucleoporin NUP42 n=1 Tax=Elysia marginata TaxID=1093978 RepID=A0AAV4GX56_9GAST|nr:nucleoporin-like protein 2 [Elysia marginata]